MGRWPPVSLSNARMAAVASSPSISGMWTSSSAMSKPPARAASTASRPLPTSLTSWPSPLRMASTSRWFTLLSSATSTLSGRRLRLSGAVAFSATVLAPMDGISVVRIASSR